MLAPARALVPLVVELVQALVQEVVAALRHHQGNVSRTAEAIGMVRQSLQQKIREHDLRDAMKDDQ